MSIDLGPPHLPLYSVILSMGPKYYGDLRKEPQFMPSTSSTPCELQSTSNAIALYKLATIGSQMPQSAKTIDPEP